MKLKSFLLSIRSRYSIDGRSLALFRIGLAAIIILDLIDRAKDISAFYADAGVMPREWLLNSRSLAWRFLSLHMQSGSVFFEEILFVIAGVAAVALLLGYRTRLATVLSWLFVTSIQIRNPLVGYGADTMLRMLLFWGMFLPLGARWSLDSIREKDKDKKETFTVFSAASVALILQILFVYWFAAILKTGPDWQNGTAIYYAVSDDVRGAPFGKYLLNFPGLIPILTYGVRGFELIGPALLISPFAIGLLRPIGVALFTVMHLGMTAALNIGLLSWISIVGLLPYLPKEFWQKFSKNRQTETSASAPRFVNAVVAALILYVFVINLGSAIPVLKKAESFLPASLLHLHQRWGLFAPHPPRFNNWYEISGTYNNGTTVNISTAQFYRTKRWINFMESIRQQRNKDYDLSFFGEYVCRLSNESKPQKIAALKIDLVEEEILFSGKREKSEVWRTPLITHSCRS